MHLFFTLSPRACVHSCVPSSSVGGFYKDLSDLLVFQLLPNPMELPVTAGAAELTVCYWAASKPSLRKQALLLTRQDFDF